MRSLKPSTFVPDNIKSEDVNQAPLPLAGDSIIDDETEKENIEVPLSDEIGQVKKRAKELMSAIHEFDINNLSRGGDGCSQIHMVRPKGFRESFLLAHEEQDNHGQTD